MISRTHITEILGLGDMYDAGDVIDFQIKLPASLRCSGTLPVYDNTLCQIRGIYRPSDGVLYTFLHMNIGIPHVAQYDIPGAGPTEFKGVYGDVFVPSKFYICSSNSRLEVDTGKILGEGIIADDAIAFIYTSSVAPNDTSSLLIDGRHYTTKYSLYTRTVMNFNKYSTYNTNYIKYRVVFSGAQTLTYERKGISLCEGWRVTRNVIK